MRVPVAVLALAGCLAGCIASPDTTGTVAGAQQASLQQDNTELDRRAVAWRTCLSRSYTAQRSSTRDRALAAELAFQACATEERAALEYTVAQSGALEPAQVNQLIADGKAKLKADLIGGRRATP